MLDEFFQQGDLEAAQGLPVSPLMDRSTTSLAISQINFIEFVVAPLFLQVLPPNRLVLVTLAFPWVPAIHGIGLPMHAYIAQHCLRSPTPPRRMQRHSVCSASTC